MDNKNNKNKSSLISGIIILIFLFGEFLIPLGIIGLIIYAVVKSNKQDSKAFTFEYKPDAYKNVGKPKLNGVVNIKSKKYKADYGDRFESNDYDYTVKERKQENSDAMIQPQKLSSEYIGPTFNKFDNYSRLIKGMNPQELLELIDAFYDEFTHDIYHEASNTAHITHGVALIHNATKKKWYVIRSNNLLHKAKSMFDGTNRNELYHEYHAGDTVWIKLLPLHGSPYSSTYEIEFDVIAKYGAKRL